MESDRVSVYQSISAILMKDVVLNVYLTLIAPLSWPVSIKNAVIPVPEAAAKMPNALCAITCPLVTASVAMWVTHIGIVASNRNVSTALPIESPTYASTHHILFYSHSGICQPLSTLSLWS